MLPILNAAGCVVLAAVLVAQWFKERKLDDTVEELRTELRVARDQTAADTERIAGLDRDVVALKESLEATQTAANEAARAMAEMQAKHQTLEADAAAAAEQVKTWQDAIAERDEKLVSLNDDLTATRKRLDQAIAKLKEAGAR